jgi:hypothetical protein
MVQVYQDPSGQETQWSFRGAVAKGLAGTIGILTALVVDYIQKGNDSALLYATRLVNAAALSRFNVEAVPPLLYLAILVIAGFALVYIFEPSNKRNAFYAGAGVLGFLATFAPITQQSLQFTDSGISFEAPAPDASGAAPEDAPAPAPIGDDHAFRLDGRLPVVLAVYRPVPSQSSVIRAQATPVVVDIMIQFPSSQDMSLPPVHAWLHDGVSGRTLTLGAGAKLAQTGAGPLIMYETTITSSQSGDLLADLALRVEAQGYRITTVEAKVTRSTPQPVRLEAKLERSGTPLAIQRLRIPYKW